MKNILFVCTGNTCRSSMAEAIAKKIIKDRNMEDRFHVSSAGIYAFTGDEASYEAIEAMNMWGIDLTTHRARRISLDIINDSNIVLAMTEKHKREILRLYPEAKAKIFTLKEYVDGVNGDIDDPFGQNIEVYKACAKELKEYIEKAIDKIVSV